MKKDISDLVRDSFGMRPIAYFPIYKDITGNFNGAIMLSQLMYWFRKKSKVYKTRSEFMEEVGFTEREYKTGRSALEKLPFLRLDRSGARGKRHYTLLRSEFREFMISFIKNNPIVAERYAHELAEHPDFKAFYAEFGFGIEDVSAQLKDVSAQLPDECAQHQDACDQNKDVSASNKKIEDSNVQKTTEKDGDFEGAILCGTDANVPTEKDVSAQHQDVSAQLEDANVPSLTETKNTKTTNREYYVIDLNDDEKQVGKNPSDSSSHLPSEDKPQKGKRTPIEYTPEFEFAWKMYKVDSSMKGQKTRAFKEFTKTLEFYGDKEVIYMAIEKYKNSTSFELRPAQAASFFSGIRNPEHKYYKDYVKGGYKERLEMVKAKEVVKNKEKYSAQEAYRKDLSLQGDLSAIELLDRTSKVNVIINEKFGEEAYIGIFRVGERRDWIRFTGPDYVALPIKHPMSKTDKVKVLFHIDELRNNLYVHLHGHVWSDELEERYRKSNEGFDMIPNIEAPRKEELNDAL